ncbi:MAG: pentapeptide repeat-containing protein, partial [Alphaproteobacteria bacterium]
MDVFLSALLLTGFLLIAGKWRADLLLQDANLEAHAKISEVLRNYGLGVAGLFAATFGVMLAWRRTKALMEQARIAQEAHFTDLFTKAIEQLGNKESMELRLGAIYALERIAKNSAVDHGPIMEILTAYVREKPRLGNVEHTPAPGPDVQAVITALARRNVKFEKGNQLIDLHGADLRGVNFGGSAWGSFFGADFSDANLERARFRAVNLERANFSGANLVRAYFGVGTRLVDSYLARANLQGATLNNSDCTGADLSNANLDGIAAYNADFSGAILAECSCKR